MATHMSSIFLVTAKKRLLFLVWRRREGWGVLTSCHLQHKQPSSIANCLDSLKGHEEKVVFALYTWALDSLQKKTRMVHQSVTHCRGSSTWGLWWCTIYNILCTCPSLQPKTQCTHFFLLHNKSASLQQPPTCDNNANWSKRWMTTTITTNNNSISNFNMTHILQTKRTRTPTTPEVISMSPQFANQNKQQQDIYIYIHTFLYRLSEYWAMWSLLIYIAHSATNNLLKGSFWTFGSKLHFVIRVHLCEPHPWS